MALPTSRKSVGGGLPHDFSPNISHNFSINPTGSPELSLAPWRMSDRRGQGKAILVKTELTKLQEELDLESPFFGPFYLSYFKAQVKVCFLQNIPSPPNPFPPLSVAPLRLSIQKDGCGSPANRQAIWSPDSGWPFGSCYACFLNPSTLPPSHGRASWGSVSHPTPDLLGVFMPLSPFPVLKVTRTSQEPLLCSLRSLRSHTLVQEKRRGEMEGESVNRGR